MGDIDLDASIKVMQPRNSGARSQTKIGCPERLLYIVVEDFLNGPLARNLKEERRLQRMHLADALTPLYVQ